MNEGQQAIEWCIGQASRLDGSAERVRAALAELQRLQQLDEEHGELHCRHCREPIYVSDHTPTGYNHLTGFAKCWKFPDWAFHDQGTFAEPQAG